MNTKSAITHITPKNRIKYIRSLEMKKYRKAEKAFLAEGNKLVNDLLGHFSCKLLIATVHEKKFFPNVKQFARIWRAYLISEFTDIWP